MPLAGTLLEPPGFGVLNAPLRENPGIVELTFFTCWNSIIVESQVTPYCILRISSKSDTVMSTSKISSGCTSLEVGEIVKVGCCADIDTTQNNKPARRLVNTLSIGARNLGC